jgi:hypothetical protein
MSASGYSRQPSLAFSDSGGEKHVDTNGGDYTTRMSELFDDDDLDTPTVSAPRFDFDDDDDEEAFVYDGADTQVTRTSYREQLREVLDDDDDDDDDTAEEHEVERSLLHDREHPPIAVEDEALVSPHPTVQTRLFDAHLAWRTHALLISPQPHSHLRLPPHQHLCLHHQSCPPLYRTGRRALLY